MQMQTGSPHQMPVELSEAHDLDLIGFPKTTRIQWNYGVPRLYEAAIACREATLVCGSLTHAQ
jgi:hypothetical protein